MSGGENRLRIAAPEIVQREYMPEQLVRMRKRVPGFFVLDEPKRKSRGLSSAASKLICAGLAGLGRRLRGFVHRNLAAERQRHPELLVSRKARACRDQVTHDDVFLEAF